MNNLSRRGFLLAGAMATTVFSRLESIGATDGDSSEREWSDNLFLKGNFAPIHDEVTAYAEQQSEVIIVDAQEFDQPPVARIMMPQRVPYGFHGLWVDGVNL